MVTVLVVDDDAKITAMLRRTLTYEGYQVATAPNGVAALAQVEVERPDLIVLDWMLPGLTGPAVARRLRRDGDVPILMLTARDAVEHRVEGLDSGADDYLVKPFAAEELLARIRALLRRACPTEPSDQPPLSCADLSLDPITRETRRGDRALHLTPKEFDLLRLLLSSPRQVFTRDQLIERVWGHDFEGEWNILDVYIGYLRQKTEATGEPRLIHTVRGVGYVVKE